MTVISLHIYHILSFRLLGITNHSLLLTICLYDGKWEEQKIIYGRSVIRLEDIFRDSRKNPLSEVKLWPSVLRGNALSTESQLPDKAGASLSL